MKIRVEIDDSAKKEEKAKIDYQILILKILEDDEYFEKKVKEIRVKYGIPIKGYGSYAVEEEGLKVEELQGNDNFGYDVFCLRMQYFFPAEWSSSLEFFICSNTFFISKIDDIEIIEEADLYANVLKNPEMHNTKDSASIFVKVNVDMNFNDLVKTLKKEFLKIKRFFNDNRFSEPIKKMTIGDIDRYKKIYDLRVRKRKKFDFIANQFLEIKEFSDSEIRTMFYRYKKMIDSLRKKG